ncbi:hypothetical protein CGJ15_25015, partial [Vibrio parahaemolyticus]
MWADEAGDVWGITHIEIVTIKWVWDFLVLLSTVRHAEIAVIVTQGFIRRTFSCVEIKERSVGRTLLFQDEAARKTHVIGVAVRGVGRDLAGCITLVYTGIAKVAAEICSSITYGVTPRNCVAIVEI